LKEPKARSPSAWAYPVTHEKKTKAATDFTDSTNFYLSGMESTMKSV